MTLVRATSDLHGYLPGIEPCDLLLIAGDVCPATDHGLEFQRDWLVTEFAPWLEGLPAKEIVWVAGNHDFFLDARDEYSPLEEGREKLPRGGRPTLAEREEALKAMPSWSHYLQDGWVEAQGLKIYGTPWSLGPDVSGWAFEASEPGNAYKAGAVQMENVIADFPDDADVIVSHGPASGFGDRVGGQISFSNTWLGSDELTKWLREHEPRLCVYGHNHEGYGFWEFPGKPLSDEVPTPYRGMTLANVSYLTDTYCEGQHPVMEFEL